jgi:hypothetical protein
MGNEVLRGRPWGVEGIEKGIWMHGYGKQIKESMLQKAHHTQNKYNKDDKVASARTGVAK